MGDTLEIRILAETEIGFVIVDGLFETLWLLLLILLILSLLRIWNESQSMVGSIESDEFVLGFRVLRTQELMVAASFDHHRFD